jgi:hypothetical protein
LYTSCPRAAPQQRPMGLDKAQRPGTGPQRRTVSNARSTEVRRKADASKNNWAVMPVGGPESDLEIPAATRLNCQQGRLEKTRRGKAGGGRGPGIQYSPPAVARLSAPAETELAKRVNGAHQTFGPYGRQSVCRLGVASLPNCASQSWLIAAAIHPLAPRRPLS